MRPSALAVLRLMTSSTFVACCDRQVGRLLALENPAGVDAGLTVRVRKIAAVAHQAAGHGELAILEIAGTAWRTASAASCSLRLLKNASVPITSAPGSQLDQGREDRFEIAFGACMQDMELQPERAGRRLHVSR